MGQRIVLWRKHFLLSILVILLLPSLIHSAGAKPSSAIVGVAVGSLDEARANLAKQAGVSWIRNDVDFSAKFLNTYLMAKKHGISIIGILDYSLLNNKVEFTLDDWRDLVAKAQRTYPLIHVWEIWNEPTLRIYQLGYMDGTPEHYFKLLKVAYTVLKANDASCTVLGLGGALLGFYKDLPFAREVFRLGGGDYMDAISIHAYPGNLNLGKTWDYYKQLWKHELQQYKEFGKPFWVTETGLQSSQLTESNQVDFLKNAYAFFLEEGASGFVWFQLLDYYESNGRLVTFGLARVDLTTKPSYDVYRSLVE